ncbi:MAG: hypothetical protein H7Z40_22870 [Phycisphaerae bacterium]|nr:hypothetical protein [Gemmatimonadaceae bacterium]
MPSACSRRTSTPVTSSDCKDAGTRWVHFGAAARSIHSPRGLETLSFPGQGETPGSIRVPVLSPATRNVMFDAVRDTRILLRRGASVIAH